MSAHEVPDASAAVPRPGPLRRLSRLLLTALMVAGVALLMEVVTEASLISEVFRHMAARMFVPYNGYFYSRGDEAAAASRQLLVVDLGRPTLQRLRATWPIAYGQHARMLERIRQGRPKALFIDFQFQAERDDPSLPALQQVLCAFKADGIPVFLAAGSEAGEGRLRPELEALRDDQGRPCFRKVAVAYQPSEIDRIVWSYPLRTELGGAALPSAALALAETLRGENLQHGHHTQMGLVWGGGQEGTGPAWQAPATAPEHDAEAGHEAAHTGSAHYCRAPGVDDIVPLQAFFKRLVGYAADNRPNCPMQASIEAALLTAPKTAEQAQALAAQLQGRAVLYGGSFDPNDFVTSPLQGEIPGVYLHAQATDNLLRYGADWRHPDIAGPLGHAAELPMTFAALFFIALSFGLGRGAAHLLGAGLQRLPGARHLAPAGAALCGTWHRLLAWLHPLPARGLHEVVNLFSRLGQFYVSLLIAVPLSLLLEQVMHVSVIGYSSVLVFCLMGEVFSASREMAETIEEHGHHHHPHPAPAHPEEHA